MGIYSKPVLTMAEAAEIFGVTKRWIRECRRNRGLRSVRIGRRVYIRPKDLEEFLEAHVEGQCVHADSLEDLVDAAVRSARKKK